MATAARTWRDAPRKSDLNPQLYSVWPTREAARCQQEKNHSPPSCHERLAHLQHQPQLVTALHVLLVEHPVELDHVGVVGESFQDVVLRLDLLIDVLENTIRESGLQQSPRLC